MQKKKLKELYSAHLCTYHLDAAIIILLYLCYHLSTLLALHLPIHLLILFAMFLNKQVANISALLILSPVNAEC